jgi:RND family efflux transporter MFP subunit
MLTRRLVWSLIGAALVVFAFYTMGFGRHLPFRSSTPPPKQQESPPLPVVHAVTPRVVRDEVKETLAGTVEPFNEAIVRTPISGFLKWKIGDRRDVRQGEVVAEIEMHGLEGELAEALADLEYAQALLVEAQAKADVARAALARTGKDTEARAKAQGERTVAEARVGVCRAGVKVKEARLKRLTTERTSRKIVAPITGTLRSRSFQEGAWIDAEGPNGRRELFRLGSLDVVRVVFKVPDKLLPQLSPGGSVKLSVPGSKRTVDGRVVEAVRGEDGNSHLVKLRVDNKDRFLKPNTKVETTMSYKPGTASFWVPAGAVVRSGRTARVLVLVEDAVDYSILYRPVREGESNGPEIKILNGLRGNEILVENANEDLANHTLVRVEEKEDRKGKANRAKGIKKREE